MTSRTVGADVTAYASDVLGRRVSTTTASGDTMSFAWDQVGRLTGTGDAVMGAQTDYTYCCAPGLMEALIARKDESYGSTEEVFA